MQSDFDKLIVQGAAAAQGAVLHDPAEGTASPTPATISGHNAKSSGAGCSTNDGPENCVSDFGTKMGDMEAGAGAQSGSEKVSQVTSVPKTTNEQNLEKASRLLAVQDEIEEIIDIRFPTPTQKRRLWVLLEMEEDLQKAVG